MLSKNKISVIVPVYNLAEYLPRCLDSILNQTYKNLEVIVISDGSTDETNEIVKGYAEKDKRIIAIFKENSGVSDTRNKGLEMATGDYIGFVDGDDYIEPEMYELLLRNAIENNADISHCGYQMVFPSRVDYYYNTGKKVIQNNEKGVLDIIKGDYVEPGICNKLYKKEVINGIRMIKGITMNEDVLFNVCAFMNAQNSFYEDKALYHYIKREGSATTEDYNYNQLFDPIKVSKMIVEKNKKSNEEIKKVSLNRYIYSILATLKIVKCNKLKVFYNDIEEYRLSLRKVDAKALSSRMKLEKFLALYFPGIYILIYKIYNSFTKSNRKYKLN